jgi:fatty acid desaturase
MFVMRNFNLIKLNASDMKKNMGTADRILRSIIAIAIAILYFTNVITGVWGIIALVVAIVFLLTSFVSFCPLYLPFGLSTCKVKDKADA